MNTYLLCKQLIALGKGDTVKEKLDVFLLTGSITDEEYTELNNLA